MMLQFNFMAAIFFLHFGSIPYKQNEPDISDSFFIKLIINLSFFGLSVLSLFNKQTPHTKDKLKCLFYL